MKALFLATVAKKRENKIRKNFVVKKRKNSLAKSCPHKQKKQCLLFADYWKECTHTKNKNLYIPLVTTETDKVIRAIDRQYNKPQLSIKTPFGTICTFTKYLLYTLGDELLCQLPSLREIFTRAQLDCPWYNSKDFLTVETVLTITNLQRFLLKFDSNKTYDLVHTYANLEDLGVLNKYCSPTQQQNIELIRYYNKDLLVYGYMRRFNRFRSRFYFADRDRNRICEDIMALTLRYYHIYNVPVRWIPNYFDKYQESVTCFPYKDRVDDNMYVCLARSNRRKYNKANEDNYCDYENRVLVQMDYLLPIYKITLHEYQVKAISNREQDRMSQTRYARRKWSAFEKLVI